MSNIIKKNDFPIAQQLFAPTAPPALKPLQKDTVTGRFWHNVYLEQVEYTGQLTSSIMGNYREQQRIQHDFFTDMMTAPQKMEAVREEYVARSKIARSAGQIAEIEAQERLAKFNLMMEKMAKARNNE